MQRLQGESVLDEFKGQHRGHDGWSEALRLAGDEVREIRRWPGDGDCGHYGTQTGFWFGTQHSGRRREEEQYDLILAFRRGRGLRLLCGGQGECRPARKEGSHCKKGDRKLWRLDGGLRRGGEMRLGCTFFFF